MSQNNARPDSGVTHKKTGRKAAKALLADLREQLTKGNKK